MPRRRSARTLLTAVTVTAMLATGAALAGCSTTPAPQASEPSPSVSAAGLISPQNADDFGLPAGEGAVRIELCLPASQELNLNPSLLTGFLEEKFGLPAASAGILRTKFLTEDKQLFA